MPTLSFFVTGTGGGSYLCPTLSMTKRLRLRICSGPSLSVRRQAGSHGASQTRPQIELNGLVAVIASNASAYFSSQMRAM